MEFEIFSDGEGSQSVEMIERGRKGVYKVVISEACAHWFGKVLCEASYVKVELAGKVWRFTDVQNPVLVTTMKNRWGELIKFNMTMGR
ncbi:hypothetical protein FRX31_028317 [Thalictrum thalictroides]|uniref:Uncharacterized protein n=1 Tax=Thalictrum thalictroides TaxID=46969 RepID=A0A7J6VB17_THATH|nr:hypothetical protein FRX31_028317 [Thalictrum thalictroides]